MGVTSNGLLKLLPFCGCLEELDLSGLASVVRDPFLKSVARAAKTLQRLKLAKCVFLTDKGICFLVEYLWIELLDISGCHRITDSAIEVLAEVIYVFILDGIFFNFFLFTSELQRSD